VAHYVAGVLDRDSMARILEELGEAANFQPGDRVKTLRGSMRGTSRVARRFRRGTDCPAGKPVARPKSELMTRPLTQ